MARRKRENQRAQGNANPSDVDYNALPRQAQAIRLRRLGYTYQQIADRVGYANESSARTAVKLANKRVLRDEAQALIGWQLDQLDAALSVVLERITRNDENSLWAVDRLTPLLKRQAELMGLDAEKNQGSGQSVQRVYVGVAVEGV